MHPDRSIHAPQLNGGLAWLNVARPLQLDELRGHLVILDFWTYCCINCMHVLAVLAALEDRHRDDPFVVIGVHSAKFTGEKEPERIADAISRYGIRHPVVVDSELRIWRAYGIRSWPTLVVVRPDGTIAAIAPGEPDPAMLERFVADELADARARGTLAARRLDLTAIPGQARGPLWFPGKVIVAPDSSIVVSDSGHHRVVFLSGDGEATGVVGSGIAGHADGTLAEARLDDPQGLAFADVGRVLYVADARAHVVRRIDRVAGTVQTIAGTGELGVGAPSGGAPAKRVALRSPWDLALDERAGVLYIAMAGSHQIWRLTLGDGQIEVFAGTGAEALGDGPLAEATFAQPSGLALDAAARTLYVADSETSAVRAIDLGRGEVRTLVGAGLFDFGDVDGDAPHARLQHAIGLCLTPDGVVVADTYNHKLRQVDPQSGGVATLWAGSGEGRLREPAGVAWDAAEGSLVLADTGHHRVVRVARDGSWARPIAIGDGIVAPVARAQRERPILEKEVVRVSPAGWFTALLELPPGEGMMPGAGKLVLEIVAPKGRELAKGSMLAVTLEVSRRPDLLRLEPTELRREARGGEQEELEVDTQVATLPEAVVEAEVVAKIDFVACDDVACTPGESWFRLPVRLVATAGRSELRFRLGLA